MGGLGFDLVREPPNVVVTTAGVGGNPPEDGLCEGCPLADGVGVEGAGDDGAWLPLLLGVELDMVFTVKCCWRIGLLDLFGNHYNFVHLTKKGRFVEK